MSYILLTVALLLGLVVPARPLGSGSLSVSSLGLGLAPRQDRLKATDSRQWDLLDWTIALNIKDTEIIDKPVDVIGFVFHPSERPFDGFYVARYTLNCCIADGSGTGLPVVWSQSASLENDKWVRVQGTIGKAEINGEPRTAIIATSVEPVEQPSDPYLYP